MIIVRLFPLSFVRLELDAQSSHTYLPPPPLRPFNLAAPSVSTRAHQTFDSSLLVLLLLLRIVAHTHTNVVVATITV